MNMHEPLDIVGEIVDVRTIAIGGRIRELRRLEKVYGKSRWRKLKGRGRVRFRNGAIRWAELHWYEAAGIGKKEIKIKRFLRASGC